MSLSNILNQITETVESDSNLDISVKDQICDLIEEVRLDPTPANLKALSIIVEKIKGVTEYVSQLKNDMKFAD